MRFLHLLYMSLWKNWILHKRHYIVTAFEILPTVLISLLTFYLASQIREELAKEGMEQMNQTIYKRHQLFGNYPRFNTIWFAPNTSFNSKLMTRRSNFIGGKINIVGFDSENTIIKEIKKADQNLWGAVIFSEVDGDHVPSVLKYKLRPKADFISIGESYFNGKPTERVQDSFRGIYSDMLDIQAMIDLNYIRLLQTPHQKEVAGTKLFIQRMPYPPFESPKNKLSPFFYVPMVIIIGFVIPYIIVLKRVVDEKNNRAKEMMKMMGMSTPGYWAGVFISNFIVMLIICIMITAVYIIPYKPGYTVLQDTPFLLFFAILLLYCTSSLLFCCVLSTLFKKAAIAVTLLIVVSIVTTTIPYVYDDHRMAYIGKVLSCLVPNMALTFACFIMSVNDAAGKSYQWNNILEPPFDSSDSFNLGTVFIMMSSSCFIYVVLLLYLDTVWPWQPGVPKSPLFFLYPSYWSCFKRKSKKYNFIEKENSEYFEQEPLQLAPSVVISHLSKVFTSGNIVKVALNDLSLNLYPGQITALLGHNGAGKTTTMNILTGIYPPTSGSISINGHDIVKDTNAARRSLGLCPQHNVLYDSMTVTEHLKFFAGLKGMPLSAMKREIPKLLRELELWDKKNTPSKDLSGGMKRKLSFGNAVIGEPQILILDEPTTGLDPEARRVIWDVLERLRQQCTILLTTHYMEEADTLGDRIAIMASGTVQCCGSALFLKRKFGAGYQLQIEKANNCNIHDISNLVKFHVPEAKLSNNTKFELTFLLSNTSQQLSALFLDLEKRRDMLGIVSCGITVTTMDDVFLKVGQMAVEQGKGKEDQYQENNVTNGTMSVHNIRKSKYILFQQMKALLMKRAYYARRHLSLLIFQILLPMAAVILYAYLQSSHTKSAKSFNLNLDALFKEKKVGFYHRVDKSTKSGLLVQHYKKTLENNQVKVLAIETNDDPNAYLIEVGMKDRNSYVRHYLVGGSMESSGGNLSLVAWYNGIHYNLGPISVNLMTTSLLRYATQNMNETIYTTIHPFGKETEFDGVSGYEETIKMLNAVFVALGLAFLSSSPVVLPVIERVTKAKLLQRMCGVNAAVYWLMHLLWDYLIHFCSSVLLLIPFIYYQGGFLAMDAVGAVFACLLLYGLSSITLSYLLSYIPKTSSTGLSISIAFPAVTGMISTIMMPLLKYRSSSSLQAVEWFLRLFPIFSATSGINTIYLAAQVNIKCLSFKKSDLYETCVRGLFTRCCRTEVLEGKSYQATPYLSWENGAGKEFLALFLTFILWSCMILLIETILPKMCYSIMQMIGQKKRKDLTTMTLSSMQDVDSDVFNERKRTETIYHQNAMKNEALVVVNLAKTFGNFCAVNKLSFGVHKEECFGLLGINGAGKTTTFRMLTGDLFPTSGNAYINHFNIQKSLQKFQMSVGYCPQFDALIERLTARETIELFANLRGISENDIKYSVNTMISMCDLDAYADKQIKSFSGGTKRKLSLAVALIGAPSVVLLDEPTAGVDPVSRRKIWKAFTSMKQMLGVSFILTSHTMDECEFLCDRTAIMVNGEFKCLGAMQSLKRKFGQGYTLIIKLKQQDFLDSSKIAEIRSYIRQMFPSASLKVEYQGSLHYHLTDTSMKWSTMFAVMEDAKRRFQLEDYVISGTTLEQIFLAFARAQKGLV